MKNNFLYLALVSFAGLITVIAVLVFMGLGSNMNNNMMASMSGANMNQMSMTGMSGGYTQGGSTHGRYTHPSQNTPMGYDASMVNYMNQNNSAYHGHMNNNSYGSMNAMNYNNPSGSLNTPMNNTGMTTSPSQIIILVPVQNPQYSNNMNGMMNGMDNMNRSSMMLGM